MSLNFLLSGWEGFFQFHTSPESILVETDISEPAPEIPFSEKRDPRLKDHFIES